MIRIADYSYSKIVVLFHRLILEGKNNNNNREGSEGKEVIISNPQPL